MIEIIPTYVPRDENDLAYGAQAIRSFANSIHIDVDDGEFALHVTWPYTSVGTFASFDLAAIGDLQADVHLMVKDPLDIGVEFARAGAKRIMGHIEAFADPISARTALDAWRRNGAQGVGLGLLWQTPLDVIAPVVSSCDVVHIMMIETIGTQGIPYHPRAPERIAEFHARFPDTVISVDGGAAESNIIHLVRAGARRFGIGSAIMRAPDPKAAYEKLKQLAESSL